MPSRINKWFDNRYHGIIFGRTRMGEFLNAIYSLRLFLKYSFLTARLPERDNHRAFLIKQYHIVEKGLAMPHPKENFGIPKIKLLLSKLKTYEEKYGFDEELSSPVRNCIKEYLAANPNLDQVDSNFKEQLQQLLLSFDFKQTEGGTKTFNYEDLKNYTDFDFENFLKSRSSVRNFKNEPLKHSDIRQAVHLARHAPSVCNRQNWQLHFYSEEKLRTDLLNLQHGNGGFTDSIQGVFVVTTNIKGFTKMEQNQVFVDGGLISMNLVLSLHHLGIGSCCLNTCFPYTREKKIKKLGNIPESERLIMMIGVGYWKEEFKVAYSKKKEVDEILRIH